MNLFDDFFLLVRNLHEEKINYAVIGGIAMAFHDQPRFTKDIDLLIQPDVLDSVNKVMLTAGYFESSQPWTFPETNITLHRYMRTEGEDFLLVDVLVGHGDEHQMIIRNAVEEETDAGIVRLARKEDLIWLKRLRNSDQDQVDIRRLSNEPD